MDFAGLGSEISEASEITTESNREFSLQSLDKFDDLFKGDVEGTDKGSYYHEKELSPEMAERKLEQLFEDIDDVSDSDSPDREAEKSDSGENRELTDEEKRQKIQDYLDGKISFDEVKEIYAEYYADAVNKNKPWSWGEDIPGGDELTGSQKKAICEYAREKGMVPDVPVREENGKKYADFSEYVVFECVLDKEDWDKKDSEQFDKCNEMLKKAIEENPELAKQFTKEQLEQINRGETPSGYTWHHSEKDGVMQLVPYGVHNSTYHHGGRSEGNWADAPR